MVSSWDAASARAAIQRAVELDPDHALAHVGLARTYRMQSIGGERSLAEIRALERSLIEKALDLDPTLAEAWNAQAMLQAEDKEFEKAAQSIQRALELNPNSADAWAGYWNFLLLMNRQEEALAHERGEASARRVGEGLELHQMRDYQWSDDARHIDWRAISVKDVL